MRSRCSVVLVPSPHQLGMPLLTLARRRPATDLLR